MTRKVPTPEGRTAAACVRFVKTGRQNFLFGAAVWLLCWWLFPEEMAAGPRKSFADRVAARFWEDG